MSDQPQSHPPRQPQPRAIRLPPAEIERRRAAMRDDVWLFMKWVCQPQRASASGQDYVERFHRPLAYLLKGDAARLAVSLDIYNSEVTIQIRSELTRRGIDWHTSSGIRDLKRLLTRVNNRISRSMGKTTLGMDVICHEITFDPDTDIGIASKSDPAAWEMCRTIGSIIRSDEYALYFHDRLFPLSSGKGYDYDSYVTQEWIMLRGGKRRDHKCVMARGINSQWYSWHGNWIYCDDLCSTEAKQGVASVEDALRFIASMSGLSKADRYGGTREIFNGTITGPRDDNSVLARNDDYISLRVPIWTKPVVANIRNLMLDGTPTLPEWYSVEDIRRKRKKEMENPLFGRISWLQNFELTAHESGAMSFSMDMLRRAMFVWVAAKTRDVKGKETTVRMVRRYLWEDKYEPLPDGSTTVNRVPKRNPEKPPHIGECLCWAKCGLRDHEYVEFNPANLPRVLGTDQAFAASGDKWSIANISRDPFGYLYALRGRSGYGYDSMIAALPLVCSLYGGRNNFPRKVGIESNAVQSNTAYWLQRSEDVFGLLARRIEKVSPGTTSKTTRIMNNVYSAMEIGTLLIDPEDVELTNEALAYDPNAENPADDILDSIAIGTVLHTVTASDPEQDKALRLEEERRYNEDVDPLTGVDISTDFMGTADTADIVGEYYGVM